TGQPESTRVALAKFAREDREQPGGPDKSRRGPRRDSGPCCRIDQPRASSFRQGLDHEHRYRRERQHSTQQNRAECVRNRLAEVNTLTRSAKEAAVSCDNECVESKKKRRDDGGVSEYAGVKLVEVPALPIRV